MEFQEFHAGLSKAKLMVEYTGSDSSAKAFFCFNEVSSLLGSSNLISCSALFYLMCSVPSFRLKAYFHGSFFFFLIYPNDFWSIDKRQFCLAFFSYSVLSSHVWKYSPQNFKILILNCMGHTALTWSLGRSLFVNYSVVAPDYLNRAMSLLP